jgi:hypothetical protein
MGTFSPSTAPRRQSRKREPHRGPRSSPARSASVKPTSRTSSSSREAPYDFAVALRVGALDGRHPEADKRARRRIAAALKPGGRLFIDGGDPLREISLDG